MILPRRMLAWIIYGASVALYVIGHTVHRLFAPRTPGWRPGKQRAFAMSNRQWSLRCKRLSLMRMKLDGVRVVRMPKELQQGLLDKSEDPR